MPAWEGVDAWAARQPKKRRQSFTVRDGEKGPLRVKALQQRVQTKDQDGGPGPRERLVGLRSVEKKPQTWYTLSNAAQEVRWVP